MNTATHSSSSSAATTALSLPARVKVSEVVSGRYSTESEQSIVRDSQWYVAGLTRPLNWDDRRAGVDLIKLEDGSQIKLNSSGMQSVPQPGWVLLLTSGNQSEGYTWTLYGITQ